MLLSLSFVSTANNFSQPKASFPLGLSISKYVHMFIWMSRQQQTACLHFPRNIYLLCEKWEQRYWLWVTVSRKMTEIDEFSVSHHCVVYFCFNPAGNLCTTEADSPPYIHIFCQFSGSLVKICSVWVESWNSLCVLQHLCLCTKQSTCLAELCYRANTSDWLLARLPLCNSVCSVCSAAGVMTPFMSTHKGFKQAQNCHPYRHRMRHAGSFGEQWIPGGCFNKEISSNVHCDKVYEKSFEPFYAGRFFKIPQSHRSSCQSKVLLG